MLCSEAVLSVYIYVILNIQTEHSRAFISSKAFTCSSVTTFALKLFRIPKVSNYSITHAKKVRWGTSTFANKPKENKREQNIKFDKSVIKICETKLSKT